MYNNFYINTSFRTVNVVNISIYNICVISTRIRALRVTFCF